MPKLKEIAALAGVSVATVSNVLNNTRKVSPAARLRVEKAVSQLSLASVQVDSKITSEDLVSTPPSRPAPKENNEFAKTRASLMLLRLLRATQPVSRAELARRLGINRSTVTDAFKPLIASGFVIEATTLPERANRMLGRPSSNLSFNNQSDFFIGINIGVRRSQVGLTTLGGEILTEEEFDTPPEPSQALGILRVSLERLRGGAQERKLRVIGVSVPGPTDAERRKLLYAPRLGWHNIDFARELTTESISGQNGRVPIVVENDATAAAMYEARLRLPNPDRKLPNNFVLVRSGTGIGVGLVLGGEVFRGSGQGEGIAGEFGHMTIVAGGKPCACGNRGCWEMYASASSASSLYMGDRIRLGDMRAPRYVEIVARAEAGELRAQRTLERIGEYLGIGIGNVIMGLGVPQVILSGRVVYGWRFIKEPLHKAVAQSMADKLQGWSVEPGEPTGAGLGGAFEVAVDAFLTSSINA